MVFQKIEPRYTRGVCVCVCVCNIWTDVKLLWFEPFHICRGSFHICRGTGADLPIQSNEAMAFRWMSGLINHLYLQNSVWTVDQAVTLRCFESTRLPQSVLHASEPSSVFSPKPCRRQYYDFLTHFRRDHVADELWVILGNNRRNIIFWIFNILVKTLWTLVKTPFDNIGCPTSFSRSTSCGSFINLVI